MEGAGRAQLETEDGAKTTRGSLQLRTDALSETTNRIRESRNCVIPAATGPRIITEPANLLFPPPHRGSAVQNIVVLYNKSNHPCIFKVKAQTPRRYYTKPTTGILAANGAVRVCFILRPQGSDLPPNTRDRFRLCARFIPASCVGLNPGLLRSRRLKKLWDEVSGEGMTTMTRDLRCWFGDNLAPPLGACITVLDPVILGLDSVTDPKRETVTPNESGGNIPDENCDTHGSHSRVPAGNMKTAASPVSLAEVTSVAESVAAAVSGDEENTRERHGGDKSGECLFPGCSIRLFNVILLMFIAYVIGQLFASSCGLVKPLDCLPLNKRIVNCVHNCMNTVVSAAEPFISRICLGYRCF